MNSKNLSLRQNQEEPSPTTIAYQKSLNSMKQTTFIRKITTQTLSPIIKKIEQHIQNLLEQSAKMRQQSQLLEEVQATNKEYKAEIQELKGKIGKLSEQMVQINQNNLIKQKGNEKKILNNQSLIMDLQKDSAEKKQKIKKMIEMTENQTQLFNLTKQNINQNNQVLKKQIAQFYEKTIRQNLQMNEKLANISLKTEDQQKSLNYYSGQIKSLRKITTLYESERQQIHSQLLSLIQLKNFAILRQQYEKDKKYQKIQNELVKKDIQKILNQALTPEIRSFLPKLIHNIELLKKLETQIKECNADIIKLTEKQCQIQDKILNMNQKHKKDIQEKQSSLMKVSMQLGRKYLELKEEIQMKGTNIQQIKQALEATKIDTDSKFESFIENNKTRIYLAVIQSKPVQIQEQQKRLKQKIFGFEQKVQMVQEQVIQRCDNVLNLGINLESKLETFQNRITKAKSDMKVQSDSMKNILESYGKKMNEAQIKNHEQSQVISKILQILLINTSLQIDQEYLNFSGKYNEEIKESYISFHDGVIYQVNNDVSVKRNQIIYRKKQVNKQILKRSTLKESAKLIDYITQKLKNWKWTDNKERPSHFFIDNIYPAYENMYSQKKDIIQARRMYFNFENNKNETLKLPSSRLISPQKSKQSIMPKNSSARLDNLSFKNATKTIEERNQSIDSVKSKGNFLFEKSQVNNENASSSAMYQTLDFKRPNRIQLKKIDQKEKESTQKHNNRYPLHRT